MNYLLILILLIPQIDMNSYQYEVLLGNDIEEVKIFDADFTNKSEDNHYSIPLIDNPREFFNNHIYYISFSTDNNQKINNINVSLTSLINESFYNSFVEIYGEPSSIMVEGEIINSKKSTFKKGKAIVTKEHRKTKQGSFNDNPRFIVWKKDNYLIEVLMKYEQGKSEISYRKTS